VDDLVGLETPVVGVNLDEPLLTADQIARLLAVPRSSVYEYARRRHGRLPSSSSDATGGSTAATSKRG
jgi:hypothetical protein